MCENPSVQEEEAFSTGFLLKVFREPCCLCLSGEGHHPLTWVRALSWVWVVGRCGYWSGFTCVYIHNLEGDFEPTSFMSANCVCNIGVLRFTCGFFSVSRDPSQKQEPLSGGLLPWNPHWLATAAPSPWLFCFSNRCFSSHLFLRS